MKTQYKQIKDEPRKLTEAEEIIAGEFLWNNFRLDFHAKRKGINRSLLESNLKRLLFNQGAEVPNDLCRFMSDEEVIRSATELYTYIQLTCEGIQTEYWPKALEQSNPYVLRYNVFALHNRMYDLMVIHKKPDDKKWVTERSKTYKEAREAIKQIDVLSHKYPAFAHFLLGYSHYTLAMGATEEHAKKHWKEAYAEFLMTEETEKKNPTASFIVNLGQGIYKDMPFDNLEGVKAEIETKLTKDEMAEIKRGLPNRLKLGR